MERTLVMIKPDCVQRKMVGAVITAIEGRGLDITRLQRKRLSLDEASNLYKDHRGKWFFERNIKHVTSGAVVLMEVSGKNAVAACRELVDSFRTANRDVIVIPRNLVHSTESPENSDHELNSVGFND